MKKYIIETKNVEYKTNKISTKEMKENVNILNVINSKLDLLLEAQNMNKEKY